MYSLRSRADCVLSCPAQGGSHPAALRLPSTATQAQKLKTRKRNGTEKRENILLLPLLSRALALMVSNWTQWQLESRSGRILPNNFLAQKQKKSRGQGAERLLER
jgi:hypothetical protein